MNVQRQAEWRRKMHLAMVATLIVAGIVVLYLLRSVIFPVLFALFLAYALHPLVDRLERVRIHRTLGSLIITFVTVALVLTFLLILIPTLINEFNSLRGELPGLSEKASSFYVEKVYPWTRQYLDIELPRYMTDVKKLVSSKLQQGMPLLVNAARRGITGAFGAAGWLFNLAIIPFFTFFFLRDYLKFTRQVTHAVPPRYRDSVFSVLGEINHNLSRYFRGQLIVLSILTIIYVTGLRCIGLEAAVAMGAISGVLFLLPYIGPAIAYCLAMFLALLNLESWTVFMWITILYLFATQLESFVLTPRITGERVGLVPWQVVLIIMVFASIFGIVGVVIAIPSGAVIRIVGRRIWCRYVQSSFYGESPEPPPGGDGPVQKVI
ncbi:AI-2E family transporter [bacterium]|nr:AI-2E family transporter [candidate division CSSED10-310 bacterium]